MVSSNMVELEEDKQVENGDYVHLAEKRIQELPEREESDTTAEPPKQSNTANGNILKLAGGLVFMLLVLYVKYIGLSRVEPTSITSGSSAAAEETLQLPDKMNVNYPGSVVIWYAPFLSKSGYGSEARDAMVGLLKLGSLRAYAAHHGDSVDGDFVKGLPAGNDAMLKDALVIPSEAPLSEIIPGTEQIGKKSKKSADGITSTDLGPLAFVICHSEPGAWSVPRPNWQTTPCPPRMGNANANIRPYTIGRTMFETDRLPNGWDTRINEMDEVWVPTEFHKTIFVNGGVEEDKVQVIGEAIDTSFFNPAAIEEPYKLRKRKKFAFLSVFKWENRKGWDILVRAFLQAFGKTDDVSLHILTHDYHDSGYGKTRREKIKDIAETLGIAAFDMARIKLIDEILPTAAMPSLYASADAFVLPTRGEGWGRPIVEAMSMGLPVIATNWSGPTEFLNDKNGYPLKIDGLTEVTEGAFKGHKWAEPSEDHLIRLMKAVVADPDRAQEKGERARRDMVENYSPSQLAKKIEARIKVIENKKNIKDALALAGEEMNEEL